MTAAMILDACCPPLVSSLVEDLLSTWHITAEEAREIRAIVNAWGDEKACGRSQFQLRAEIAGRIHRYLNTKRASTEMFQ